MYNNTNQSYMSHHRVLETVQNCEAVCEFTEYSVLQMGGSSHKKRTIKIT
jgi:hypothetical protein